MALSSTRLRANSGRPPSWSLGVGVGIPVVLLWEYDMQVTAVIIATCPCYPPFSLRVGH